MAKGKAKKKPRARGTRVVLARRKDPLMAADKHVLVGLVRKLRTRVGELREQVALGVRFENDGAMLLYVSPRTCARLDKLLDKLRPHLGSLSKRLVAELEREMLPRDLA